MSEASARSGRRKSMVGTVVSTKMDKTAVVAVERRHRHPLYHKIIRSTKRYKAHDMDNSATLGDVVRIVETRPMSREKRWRIAETLVRGNVAEIAPREIGVPEEALLRPQAETEEETEPDMTLAGAAETVEAAEEAPAATESETIQALADDMDPTDYEAQQERPEDDPT